jgi:hypothetical protein
LQSQFETIGDIVVFHVPLRMRRAELAAFLGDTEAVGHRGNSDRGDKRYRSLLNVAQDVLAFERARKAIPGLEGILGDPAWLILLDLFVRGAEGRTTTVSSATLASGAPATTGLRYVTTLTALGYLERTPHPDDDRSVLLSLSHDARIAIAKILRKAN